MMNNLLDLVKEKASEAVSTLKDVPAGKQESIVKQTVSSVEDGMKAYLGTGNISDFTSLMGGKNRIEGNPVTDMLNKKLTSDLGSKIGLDSNQSGSIAAAIIPAVLKGIVQKFGSGNDGEMDINKVIGELTGGKVAGINVGEQSIGNMTETLKDKAGDKLSDLVGGLFGKK